ncbi:flagellar hook-length control protein FliK [Psychromonas sp.]|uniref:flagellar hook-length control protein FliK n=1 Tax=Psychromonas sp. TaxID=1884585 RepID=UPI0039E3F724
MVKHLAGKVLSLSRNTVSQGRDVLLNNPDIKGRLGEGQVLQVKLSVENNPTLAFFSPASAKSTSIISLTEQQLQRLLKLPANQIIPSNVLAKSVNVELPMQPVLQQLSQMKDGQNQGLIQKLQPLIIDKIDLKIKPNGEIELLLQGVKPVASIPVTKEIAQALAPLKLPHQQAVTKRLNLPSDAIKQIQVQTQTQTQAQTQAHSKILRPETNTNIQSPGSEALQKNIDNKFRSVLPPADTKKYQETSFSMKEAIHNLTAAVQERPLPQSVINQTLLSNKSEQISLVQSLLRIVQPKSEAPAITLQSIEKALADDDFFKGATEKSSKQLIEQVLQQIKQSLPQGKEQDANQIRQLLTTPALSLSASQMVIPAPSQGLMSGLVTLLQMSLSARLARSQSKRSEHITSTLNNVLNNTGHVKPDVSIKALNDMSQLERKHQLMKEIGRLLSGHQTNKLSNAEQMIQGQETFYYNLPSALGGSFKDIELLIKREDNNKEAPSSDEQSNKMWQLTMKLAVGKIGEILTKAKLRENTLEIHFYASNEAVKIQVMNYLPLLLRKLDSLGIEVSKSDCQLGKIPDTLRQRPNHVFQAKA